MITKPGRYGTLHLYSVTIVPADTGCAPYAVRRWAYSADHAVDIVTADPMVEGDDVTGATAVRA